MRRIIRGDRTDGLTAAVSRGEQVIDPERDAAAWTTEPDPLTERERRILWRGGEGRSLAEIALSEDTLREERSEGVGKLGATKRIVASRAARQNCWL